MEANLVNGVKVFVQPTEKFKTIQIEYKFRTAYDPQKAAARTLLKNILETNTKKYPTQSAMDRQMSWLYGATLSTRSQRYGKQHVLTFALQIVNDKFIMGDNRLFEEGVSFLNEVIFRPNLEDHHFHEPTFIREKQNLENYFASLAEDKAAYSQFKLNQLLYRNTGQAFLGLGDPVFLEQITPSGLLETYRDMIHLNQVDILFSGDVAGERVMQALELPELASRDEVAADIFVAPTVGTEVLRTEEEQEVSQGKLYFGFASPLYYMGEHFYAGMVFNGLFGGFPHSKLFQNVREKESLAYAASSSMDFLRGNMSVSTGIDFKQKEKTEAIVLQQLEDMRAGDFQEDLIQQTKDMLINQFKQNDDHQSRSLAKIYQNRLLAGRDVADEEWIAGVERVTKEDIVHVAQLQELKAVYFLKGVSQADA